MARVLLIDDELDFCLLLTNLLKRLGYSCEAAHSKVEAEKLAASGPFDVVLLDVILPDGSGLDLIRQIRSWPENPEVIIVTGLGDPDGAEMAIKSGAWDYIQKGGSIHDISLSLTRALEYRQGRGAPPPMVLRRDGILGHSSALRASLDMVARAARSDAGVLITGESGVGKELFALAIHHNSPRANRPFIVVDCTALPETLVESILFGHAKGSFTGADRDREGLIAQAHGGTLFLDEIGELPPPVQKAFLRVLHDRNIKPVGGRGMIEVDFRLVAATNQNLDLLAREGRFRQDLLFRLRTVVIDLPPLKDRPEDIKELTLHYLSRICEQQGQSVKGFTPQFMEALMKYDWPGNVRELIKTLEAAVVGSGSAPTLFHRYLPEHILVQRARRAAGSPLGPPVPENGTTANKSLPLFHEHRDKAVRDIERGYLSQLIKVAGGDMEAACRLSGLSQSWLYALLKKHKLRLST